MILLALLFAMQLTSFATPEGGLYWKEADLFLVSNIQGSPSVMDGEGFISLVSPEGKMVKKTFLSEGLNAPKGIALVRDKLYIADINGIAVFKVDPKRRMGAFTRRIDLKDLHASFLNDIAADKKGRLYVTDTATDTIYRVDLRGSIIRFSTDISSPNGIVYDDKRSCLWVVSYGSGSLYRVNPDGAVAAKWKIAPSLDGIILAPDGSIIISSWDGHLYRFTDGKIAPLLAHLTSPADIAGKALADGKMLLMIPEFKKDRVRLETVFLKK